MEIQVVYCGEKYNEQSSRINQDDINFAIRLYNTQKPFWHDDLLNQYDETVRDLMLAGF